ncbi:tRNA pseudouridine(55) synthase TruB [Synechococcus elongatus]|uniref:tRNA pseudouridine synthase B n=2 Tax=Synechococcus elongatus TaxID=32046 RepID=TRUB_SYNE7|nr:tRNA pseudouridine(55) synthase TruB [Synechococcus elongatus]Q5N5A0.1 RecName: Full=tRNA pseudouridine synthase B; AltName: Full=tRNA pseudouridine(55) synthase; Short=Psi55 synthase; AltName: Full=tRNA pseudouridylate synthase; AltName: Full=tRNA-uridine isomerase [Synechococcus elongatus PCC 6301]Q8KIY0.2 RecName: Full=tRNA pseudouridine synthase B; AltName: Full=tRNA pseudouridine(55) synthase; Short=Psi55 synthase; AltName: Full=tRNA pseudouridylate synthase; AltName: Full=tRNA-uridine is
MSSEGFVNLDKPAGWTSHDCVAKLRRLLRERRIGHGGTLDPAVTGVLPIAVGRATRLLPYLPSGKTYVGTIRFGLQTSTDDLTGDRLAEADTSHLSREAIEAALPQFLGHIQQQPPQVSAVQVQGQRLYQLARRGEAPTELPWRTVEIQSIRILQWRSGSQAELSVEIHCGAGTYIRSLARDLGAVLGVGGTLAELRRTASSGFDLNQSTPLTELLDGAAVPLLALDLPLQHLAKVQLSAETSDRWRQGQAMPVPDSVLPDAAPVRVYDLNGQFLGIGAIAAGLCKPKVVLAAL